MFDSTMAVSLSLLGFWLTVGFAVLIWLRDKQRIKDRKLNAEEQLAQWIEEEKARGASAGDIAGALEAKRKEIAENPIGKD